MQLDKLALVSTTALGWLIGVTNMMGVYMLIQGGTVYGVLMLSLTLPILGMLYTGYWQHLEQYTTVTQTDVPLTEFLSPLREFGSFIDAKVRHFPEPVTLVSAFFLGILFLFGNMTFEANPEWVARTAFRIIGGVITVSVLITAYRAHKNATAKPETS